MTTPDRLCLADAGVVGECVDLPDDRHLRPVPVVGRGLPDREQPGAEVLHHRPVDLTEGLGELVGPTRPQVDGLVQIQQRVAVELLHHNASIVDSGTMRA